MQQADMPALAGLKLVHIWGRRYGQRIVSSEILVDYLCCCISIDFRLWRRWGWQQQSESPGNPGPKHATSGRYATGFKPATC